MTNKAENAVFAKSYTHQPKMVFFRVILLRPLSSIEALILREIYLKKDKIRKLVGLFTHTL